MPLNGTRKNQTSWRFENGDTMSHSGQTSDAQRPFFEPFPDSHSGCRRHFRLSRKRGKDGTCLVTETEDRATSDGKCLQNFRHHAIVSLEPYSVLRGAMTYVSGTASGQWSLLGAGAGLWFGVSKRASSCPSLSFSGYQQKKNIQLLSYVSWLMAHGSWLMAHGHLVSFLFLALTGVVRHVF